MEAKLSFNLNDLAEPESVRGSTINKKDDEENDDYCNADSASISSKQSISSIYKMRNIYNPQTSSINKHNPNTNSSNGNNLYIKKKIANSSNFEGEAIQLIDFSKGFKVNPRAIDFLNSIKDDVIIISVVGKARTGKSYLMNLLLDIIGKNNSFKVASSLKSCTKGIWLWGTAKQSLSSNAKILFLDSEGTSSTDKSTRTYDSKIFALVVLISSLLLYNTYSNIDEYGISELSLAAHLSSSISANAGTDKDRLLTELAPNFIWLIRDFTLEKVHPETGEEISSKEYLELCLKCKKCAKNSKDNNMIRQNIIKYFPERDCVTLIRPVDNESDLKNLNNIPFNNLKPEFKLEFKKLKDKIYKETFPKKYNGKRINGPTLASLIIEFVKVINSGKVPNINNTWDSVVEKDVNDSYNKALSYYKSQIKILKPNQNHIYNSLELIKKLSDLKYKTIFVYNEIMEGNSETFKHANYKALYEEKLLALKDNIKKIENTIKNENNSLNTNKAKNIITDNYHNMDTKIYNNGYDLRNYEDLIEDDNDVLNEINKKINYFHNKNDIILETIKKNEIKYINYLGEICKKDGTKNLQKLDYNLKELEADLEDIRNKREVVDENDRINTEKINSLKSSLKNINEELESLSQKYKEKKEYLISLKQKIKQQKMQSIEDNLKNNIDETMSNIGSVSTEKRKKIKDEACNCQCYLF